MKALLSITAFCCLSLPVRSQTAETKPNPPTFRQALISFTWSWKPVVQKGKEAEVRFYKDGTVASGFWSGTWTTTGLRTVTLETKHKDNTIKKAALIFDPTFSTFDGTYWDGATKVSGGRKAPADPEATSATKPK